MTEPFQILSLDGGGIKGLFSAAVLAHIEKDLKTRIVDHFDLIVGTSTGGIIALALGLGISPKEIVEFYVEKGPKIFPKGWLFRPVRGLQHYVMRKFSARGLEKALQEIAGDKTLGDCQKRLVVPSYNLQENDVYLFKTPHHKRFRRDWEIPVWKVARATSAAPTYFSAYRGIDSVRLIDGGVWANNPCMVGVVEAMSTLSVDSACLKLFSIGTSDGVVRRSSLLDWAGRFLWARHASDVLLDAQSRGAFTQAKLILGTDRTYRINPKVPAGLFGLDKLSTKEHLGMAAHQSRKFIPIFEQHFAAHTAPKYQPFYGRNSDTDETPTTD